MKIRRSLLFVSCIMALSGCGNWSRNEQVITSIRSLSLVPTEGITYRASISDAEGGTARKLAYLKLNWDLISEDGASLPDDLAARVAQQIKDHLISQGCTASGSLGAGQGISHSDPVSTIRYSLNGSDGLVEVWLIHRIVESHGEKILGHLMITVHEAR